MSTFARTKLALGMTYVVLGTSLAAHATTTLSSDPIVVAVKHGDCAGAADLINSQAGSKDSRIPFLAGRMLDEGICVKKDPVAADEFYSRATDLGNRDAALEHAAKVGLGLGAVQDYELAGDICRSAGIDPKGMLSRYALGYACTVSSVAGRILREDLPRGAFVPGNGPAQISFIPATAKINVVTVPPVGVGDAPTGSTLRHPIVDGAQAIEKSWRLAMGKVPRPDAKRLDNQGIELPIDVDTTLESGRPAALRADPDTYKPLLNGDIHPVPAAAMH